MFRFLFFTIFFLLIHCSNAQLTEKSPDPTVSKEQYRASPTRHFDLIHTSLEVSFDWKNQHMFGRARLTLKPLIYSQSQLILDAKGMIIEDVRLYISKKNSIASHIYNGEKLQINFSREYTYKDTFDIYVKYIARPNEFESSGSKAITSNKGLYFINPTKEDGSKPQQIWTQGATESNSVWFPTIDAPNEKCTQQIAITVDNNFKTLSNGQLIKRKINRDGKRTDTWRLDKPHAPYLFMMAVGNFKIIASRGGNVPLTYYVEPRYQDQAEKIFGRTPEMMTFFSDLLQYPFPWPKYDQIVVRDFVSGAMENTTASVFMEQLQMNERELVDYNYDDIIAHELFHQWFGDLLTCESWSNVTLNEGFASYSEYLWEEYKQGKQQADYTFLREHQRYFTEASEQAKELIRYYYDDKDDMFDRHSYNKGAAVLHMLRVFLGNDAFFAGLNKYLVDNAFQTVELADFRMAMEEVSGQDLNWFFDQWFLKAGHPVIKVKHQFRQDTLRLSVSQTQEQRGFPIYDLPLYISLWYGDNEERKKIRITKKQHEYIFPNVVKPDLIIFDSQHQLLAEIEHPKTEKELLHQFLFAKEVFDQLEVLEQLPNFQNSSTIHKIIELGLQHPFREIRRMTVDFMTENSIKEVSFQKYMNDLIKDSNSYVRNSALIYFGQSNFADNKDLIFSALIDSSYTVVGSALTLLLENDVDINPAMIQLLDKETNINIILPLADYYLSKTDDASFEWFENKIKKLDNKTLYYFLKLYMEKLFNADNGYKKQAVSIMSDIAQSNNNYQTRFAAYQVLMSISEDMPKVKTILKKINENEKDNRLLELYGQM